MGNVKLKKKMGSQSHDTHMDCTFKKLNPIQHQTKVEWSGTHGTSNL